MNDKHNAVAARANNQATEEIRKWILFLSVNLYALFICAKTIERKLSKNDVQNVLCKGNRITKRHFVKRIAALFIMLHTREDFFLSLFGFLSNDYAKWSLL